MRKISWLLALAIPAIMISCQKEAVSKTETTSRDGEVVIAGNGAPSGAHYNLNIIGVPKPKSFNVDQYGNTQGNGRRIFVPLDRAGEIAATKILLQKGEFDVLDADGTDGVAKFQLPEPDAENDGVGDGYTDYSVYIRGLGKPGGKASMQSCFWDQQTSTEYCSTGNVLGIPTTVSVDAHGNNNKFQNVSNQLLYVWADLDADGDLDRTELFSDDLDTYYWYYNSDGLKLAQLRFYPGDHTEVWADPEPTAN